MKTEIKMKKIGLYLASLALMGAATACEENPFLGIPQVNPQEPVMSAEGLTVSYAGSAIEGDALDLNAAAGQSLSVISTESMENLPEGATLAYMMEVAKDDTFADAQMLEVVDGAIAADDLNGIFRGFYGRAPEAQPLSVRFLAYVVDGENRTRLGGADTYYGQKTIEVTPVEIPIHVESAYYFLSNSTTWDLAEAENYKMNHSGQSVYDDPVFTYTVKVTQQTIDENGGSWWKIAPQSAIDAASWDGMLGTEENGDDAMSGYLTDSDAQSGVLKEEGTYKFTVNVETMTYSIVKLSYLGTPNKWNGWTNTNSNFLSYYDGKGFKGAAMINPADGGFKFINTSAGNAWDVPNTVFGSDAAGVLSTGGGNISNMAWMEGEELKSALIEQTGLYWITADLDQMTYTCQLITSIGVTGADFEWNADEPVELTPSEDGAIWSGELTSAGEWKIVINHGWEANYGGAIDDLQVDGGNFPGFSGTKTVTLSFKGNLPVITLE